MTTNQEQKRTKILLKIGITIYVGGVLLAKLAGFENLIGIIGGIGGSIAVLSGIKLYKIKNKPDAYKEEKMQQTDERSVVVQGQAGYATTQAMFYVIAILYIGAVLIDNTALMIVGAGLILADLLIFSLFTTYYEKKL